MGTSSSVIFDLDNDGDLDIMTNEFNDRPMVLISNLADGESINWRKVKLKGTSSNRRGLGAVVEVHTETETLTQVHDGQSGYLSQSDMPLYFGLGDNREIAKLVVKWPSGREQTVESLDSNRIVIVVEE